VSQAASESAIERWRGRLTRVGATKHVRHLLTLRLDRSRQHVHGLSNSRATASSVSQQRRIMINASRMRHQHGRCSGSRSTAPHRFDAGLRQDCHSDSDGCANGCRMQTGTRAGMTPCHSRPNLRKRITKALCRDFVCGERAYLAQGCGVPAGHGRV
jgi:hypothetical protein